jgi:hypothetical protein
MKFRLSVSLVYLLLAMAPAVAKDASSAPAVGAAMTEAAAKFVASLDAKQRAIALMDFDNPKRLDWHNIPKPERKGLQLRDMTREQQKLCHALLKTALSDAGYAKLERILSLENNLKEGEKEIVGGNIRDPLRYFLTIFGEPSAKGEWGWSFEGHHMSQNFVVRDGQVVADTPSFWGANPATVKVFVAGGPEVGVRTLTDEEQLALDLVNSLDDAQEKRAVIAAEAPADYRGPGSPQPPQDAPAGLPAAEMTDAQKKTLRSLLETYTGHLAPELAAARMADIDGAGFDKVSFAWLGAEQEGVAHAYRVQGPTFVLELVNAQTDPAGNVANHIHSVWRSLKGDFAVAAK